MFIAGAVVVGGIIVAYDDYSDYRDHDRHSRYSEYGDSQLVSQINDLQNRVNSQEYDVNQFRSQIQNNFNSRINDLKREKNYSALSSGETGDYLIHSVKQEMKRELDNSIRQEQQQLEDIDRMIARINEIELQQRK